MPEQHLIRAAQPEHYVSMGTGYYVPALTKQEVYVCRLAAFAMCPLALRAVRMNFIFFFIYWGFFCLSKWKHYCKLVV